MSTLSALSALSAEEAVAAGCASRVFARKTHARLGQTIRRLDSAIRLSRPSYAVMLRELSRVARCLQTAKLYNNSQTRELLPLQSVKCTQQ